MARKKAAPSKSSSKKKATPPEQLFELIAVEIPAPLIKGMNTVGIKSREQYINFLIASSLLNYSQIWKDKEVEKEIAKIKSDCDEQNYMR